MSKIRLRYFILLIILILSCTPKPKWKGMDQAEYVKFPELGVVAVGVKAVDKQLPKLIIRNAAKKVLFQLEMGHAYDPESKNFEYNAGIEFKVYHIADLPDPLLIVVAAGPGGSDTAWEVALLGVISGKIERLWKQTSDIMDEGGFFVGDLGEGRGIGIAQWYWHGGECHACPPTKYSIQLYRWNKGETRFDIGQKFTIEKDKFDTIDERELDFPDLRHNFRRLADFW